MFEESGKGIAFCPSDDETREKAHAVVDEKDLSNILPLI
jgi:phosphoserine phosphatase